MCCIAFTGAHSRQLRIRDRRSFMLTNGMMILTTQIVRPVT
jgi:hypothetical protein